MPERSRSGWLDEFWTILLALPFLMAFLPWTQDFVSRGFWVLGHAVPVWYQLAFGAAVAWGFARKSLLGVLGR